MRAHELPSFELRPARPLGIFDGHGGSIVSELAAKEFAFRPLAALEQTTDTSLAEKAMHEAVFSNKDEALRRLGTSERLLQRVGSFTLPVVLLRRGTLSTVWARPQSWP